MSCFNRGEWSEIYAILSLLASPDVSICNSDLEELTNQLYHLKKIQINDAVTNGIIEYSLKNQSEVEIFYNEELHDIVTSGELSENKRRVYNAIENAPIGDGAFQIEGIDELLSKLTKGKTIKAKSFSKEDLSALMYDKSINRDANLKYSIKSSLGSPATLLNSSKHTDFLFVVDGLNESEINNVNSIDTRTKLVDRLNYIFAHNGQIRFVKVVDDVFEYNLRMIDSNMPLYLGNALLKSYSAENKNLDEVFINSNDFADRDLAIKKLGDFLEGVSFGFFPSVKWDGYKQVNGGLVIVKNNGSVVILDLVYYRNEVVKYLIKETKLDSPSSTRYNMLHLWKNNDGKIYFTLNLQIRYRK